MDRSRFSKLARLGEQTEVGTNDSGNDAPSLSLDAFKWGVSKKGNLEPCPTTSAAKSSTSTKAMFGRSPW